MNRSISKLESVRGIVKMFFLNKETQTLISMVRCKGFFVTKNDLFGNKGWDILNDGKVVATCKKEEQLKQKLEEIINGKGDFSKNIF